MPRHRPAPLALVLALLAVPAVAEGWRVEVAAHAWAPALSGEIETGGVAGTGGLDFADLFDAPDAGTFFTLLARRGPLVAAADLSIIGVSRADAAGGGSVRLALDQASGTLAGGLRLHRSDRATLDALVGVRGWTIDGAVAVRAPGLPVRRSSDGFQFADPIGALRLELRATPRVTLTAWGDLGGFGVGSEFTWSALALANVRITERARLGVGWRHVAFDWDRDGGRFDLRLSGPVLGLALGF